MHEFLSGSFVHFSYYTQFAIYIYILLAYCKKQYGYNKEEWRYDCNVLVVGTRGNNDTAVYKVFDEFIKAGKKEFCKLLKMVAYCEMYGYDAFPAACGRSCGSGRRSVRHPYTRQAFRSTACPRAGR